MKITEHRTKEILNWLDDKAADPALLFEKLHRDAAALIRQLQAAEQEAWHAGLDAGREQGRGKDHAHPSPSAPVGATLSNPWSGKPLDYRDVDSDPEGVLCMKPGAPLKVATSVEGLTTKEAWWAGYRAGKGLPADTPLQEALAQQPTATDEAMPALVELVTTLAATGTVTGGRIYFPERQTRELLKKARDALTAQHQEPTT